MGPWGHLGAILRSSLGASWGQLGAVLWPPQAILAPSWRAIFLLASFLLNRALMHFCPRLHTPTWLSLTQDAGLTPAPCKLCTMLAHRLQFRNASRFHATTKKGRVLRQEDEVLEDEVLEEVQVDTMARAIAKPCSGCTAAAPPLHQPPRTAAPDLSRPPGWQPGPGPSACPGGISRSSSTSRCTAVTFVRTRRMPRRSGRPGWPSRVHHMLCW